MARQRWLAGLIVLTVIVFSIIVPRASAFNPYPYREQGYTVAGTDIFTQQVCLGTGAQENSTKDIDYGYEGQSIIAHSLSFTQTTNVSLNVGGLSVQDYALTYSKTLGTISVTTSGDVLNVSASANSALYVRYESNTCLSKFRKVYVQLSTRLPVVSK